MDCGKYHTDQGYYNQYYGQQTENSLTAIFFKLKKTERNEEQEQGVGNHHLASEYIVQNVTG
jgi:hypothetical protein